MNEPDAPNKDVLEFTLIGPGYGETMVLHLGHGNWVVVDSCEDETGHPQALRYLENIGVDPEASVILVVATHWHDDHIRGMGRLVEVCRKATFACAAALTTREFMATSRAFTHRHLSEVGSGVAELYATLGVLRNRRAQPARAVANRIIFEDGDCNVRCLSPSDKAFDDFIQHICGIRGPFGQDKRRLPALRPNKLSIALWVTVQDTALLLGGDLDKAGWVQIFDLASRPRGVASVFKVPHHGAPDAHEPRVWVDMLRPHVQAVLTPWTKGGKWRPSANDAQRILACTRNAYVTAAPPTRIRSQARRNFLVQRALTETKTDVKLIATQVGAVRLRRTMGTNGEWEVGFFGDARHLSEYTKGCLCA